MCRHKAINTFLEFKENPPIANHEPEVPKIYRTKEVKNEDDEADYTSSAAFILVLY